MIITHTAIKFLFIAHRALLPNKVLTVKRKGGYCKKGSKKGVVRRATWCAKRIPTQPLRQGPRILLIWGKVLSLSLGFPICKMRAWV